MKKKTMENSCRKKTAALTTLTMLILAATALCIQAPEARATVGNNHRIDAEYYGARIHDSHDTLRSGEWYFKITAATGTSDQTGEKSVRSNQNADFDLNVNWFVGANTYFECWAGEDDSNDWDYESSVTVNVELPGTSLNEWVTGSTKQGDVTHYYRYRVENRVPALNSLTGPSSGYYDDAQVFSASATDDDGDSVTYEWKVDGEAQPLTSPTLDYKFTDEEPGSYTISVRAKDTLGGYSYWKETSFSLRARVAAPTFSPPSGTYSSAQSVTISCITKDAIIRYTTDGSSPTSSSTPYSNPITVSSTTTIRAKAFKDGMSESTTASATYTINAPPPTPTPTPTPTAEPIPTPSPTASPTPTPTPTPMVTPTPTPTPPPSPDPTQTPSPKPTGIGAFYFPPQGFYAIGAIGVGIVIAITIVVLKKQNK